MPIYFNVTDDKDRIILPGSVTIKRFSKWHPAESAQTDFHRKAGGAPAAQDMVLGRLMDDASAKFAQYAAQGTEFNSAVHIISGKDASAYMSVNMDGVFITSYLVSGNRGDAIAMETLVFSYRKIAIAYGPPAASGTSTVATVIQSFLDDLF